MWLVDNLSKTESEERRIITDVSWEDYEALLVDLVDRSSPHIAYLDGVIEIVSAPTNREKLFSEIYC
jgi:hypothetical protein